MGIRGELFSTKVILQNRTYFFNVKENRLGDLYLNIVESKNRDEGGFERQSVILFENDLQEFLQGFDESLRVMEKAAREKRRGKAGPARDGEGARDRRPPPDTRGDSDRGDGRRTPPASRRGERDFGKGGPGNSSSGRPGSSRTAGRPGSPRTAGRPGRGPDSPDSRRGGREYSGGKNRPDRKHDGPPGKKRIVVRKK